jgi:hypothetical protein
MNLQVCLPTGGHHLLMARLLVGLGQGFQPDTLEY